MFYVKWAFILTFWAIVAAFLHYTLPHRDIVRIVNTYEERQELNDWTRIFWSHPDSQSQTLSNRDVQFIQAVRPNDRPIVYRNEDTGWSWPPYFKFDTANLYTEAADSVSTKDSPQWFMIKHYGWRNELFSSFPNAISITPVAGPDASKGIPWTNIIVLSVIAAIFYAIWVRWRRFRMKRIDPTLEEIQDSWEAAEDAVHEKRGRLSRWLGTWRAK